MTGSVNGECCEVMVLVTVGLALLACGHSRIQLLPWIYLVLRLGSRVCMLAAGASSASACSLCGPGSYSNSSGAGVLGELGGGWVILR